MLPMCYAAPILEGTGPSEEEEIHTYKVYFSHVGNETHLVSSDAGSKKRESTMSRYVREKAKLLVSPSCVE